MIIYDNETNFFKLYIITLLAMIGYPVEYSWQCTVCKTWEYGSVYRFIKAAYFEIIRNKCIKHREEKIK